MDTHLYETVFEYIAFSIDLVGVTIVLWGFLRSLKAFLIAEFSHLDKMAEAIAKQHVRVGLGNYLLISLEFMIVSDIIHSVITRSTEDIIYLGLIVVIRTAIGFFLSKEIEHLDAPQLAAVRDRG